MVSVNEIGIQVTTDTLWVLSKCIRVARVIQVNGVGEQLELP